MPSVTALPRMLWFLTYDSAVLVRLHVNHQWLFMLRTSDGKMIEFVDTDIARDALREQYIMMGHADMSDDSIPFRVTLRGMTAAPLQCPAYYPQLTRGDQRKIKLTTETL